jgi:hypothetical protein
MMYQHSAILKLMMLEMSLNLYVSTYNNECLFWSLGCYLATNPTLISLTSAIMAWHNHLAMLLVLATHT